MAYCAKTDIQKKISDAELIGLTDDAKTGAIVDEKITAAIADGDALADTYYAKMVPIPIQAPYPPVVVENSKTMGIYNLFARRSKIPEIRQKEFDRVIKWLENFAKDLVNFGSATEADVIEQIKTTHTHDDRKMTVGKDSDSSSGTLDNY